MDCFSVPAFGEGGKRRRDHEGDRLNEAQLAAWVKQGSHLPGERM
jgi:hypothetical protein